LIKQPRSSGTKPQPSKVKRKPVRSSAKRKQARPGPGRPSALRAEAINQAILAEAYNLFWNLGYPDTQMEAVAAAVGISKRTLYDRYPNKIALLSAVLVQQTVIWADRPELDFRVCSLDLRMRLKQRAYVAIDFCYSGEYERSLRLMRSCPPLGELRQMYYERGHKRFAEVISREIMEVTPELAGRPKAALLLAEMLMSVIYGWWEAHLGVREFTLEEAKQYADHAVEVLLSGRSAWVNM
jgi:TetR/AcrR family transcriptional regulator, mexJK operon transcriptional repressor